MITENQQLQLARALRTSGVFISTGREKYNLMSTHWGALGKFWNKPVFILPVRESKYTHELLEETNSFAISVPVKDMRTEIMICDRLSGYDVNKFEELHLHPKRTKIIETYTVGECGLYLECKVIFTADMSQDHFIDPELLHSMYDTKDFHKLYFGEILAVYEE